MQDLQAFIISVSGTTTALGALIVGFRRTFRRLMDLMDDWSGEAERPGVPGRPGVMERLRVIEDRIESIEYHGQPNHGGSSYDAMMRAIKSISDKIDNKEEK